MSANNFRIIHQIEKGFYFYHKGYLKDTRGIWWFHGGYTKTTVKFVTADINNFSIINDDYAHLSNYFVPNIIGSCDVDSFVSPEWSRDKNHLYNANGLRIVKGIDGSSFVMLNTFWGMDKNHVFNFVTERISKTIDAESFEVIDDNDGAQDKNFIYNVEDCGEIKKKKRI